MATETVSLQDEKLDHSTSAEFKFRVNLEEVALDRLPAVVRIPLLKIDKRLDEEIVNDLLTYRPVTSERNIWAFWHSGFNNMSPWVKRNVIGWVRRLGPEWTVRILDRIDDSPNNVYRFCDSSWFPQCFNELTMKGSHVRPHMADMVRLPCVYLYGGIWIDAGAILLRHVDEICWKALEDPSSPYEMAGFEHERRPGFDSMVNSFIASKKENPFIKRWHDIFVEIWKDRTNCKDIHKHPLIKHLPLLQHSTIAHDPEDLSDYIAQCMAFDRLRLLEDPSDGFSGVRYFEEKVYMLDCWEEQYAYQKITNWDGLKSSELLSRRRDEEKPDPEAEKLVQYMLAQSSMMKVSHGIKTTMVPLAKVWDDNPRADMEPGTFAGYLRWASVNLEQTRKVRPLRVQPTTEPILRAGILEVKAP